ncbi:DUF6624 domain-containing protein [Aquimarina litoralis]|uniref:DUF6624 domain-containing protein n=1 Tax=Aquimarina litoralis TaxID=584605 RepID=UPI001C564BFE|nr:DUF6624 domain-containing protein [Aquimarina litoralis]MBW1294367.1 hypothetical protein [Aquimarina litoralis]
MKYKLSFIIFLSFVISCKKHSKELKTEKIVVIDSMKVSKQLERMVKIDQEIQFAHKPNESERVKDSLYREKDRIFKSNTDTIKRLYESYGFLGIDKVGKQGSYNFWLLVQHADHDINFQEKVLESMIKEVDRNNADASNYAYLMDRVLKNKGKKQLYGTQVKYIEDFWIIPEPLQDSVNVNKRRNEVGLSSIEDYLNEMMEIHYQMNKAIYEQNGLKGPRKYEIKN